MSAPGTTAVNDPPPGSVTRITTSVAVSPWFSTPARSVAGRAGSTASPESISGKPPGLSSGSPVTSIDLDAPLFSGFGSGVVLVTVAVAL